MNLFRGKSALPLAARQPPEAEDPLHDSAMHGGVGIVLSGHCVAERRGDDPEATSPTRSAEES